MGQPTVALTRHGTFKCRRVIAQEYMKVPSRSQKDVIARVTLRKTHDQFPTDVVVEASQLKRGLYVGRTLLPQRHRDVRVCIANTTEKPQLITPGSCLGTAVSVRVASKEKESSVPDPTKSNTM